MCFIFSLCLPYDHWCLPTSPSGGHWWVCRLWICKPFFNKVEKGFFYFLTLTFSMVKHASMVEYTSSPFKWSLRTFEAWGLAVHYLNYYLSPKILFKQELSFDVCNSRASIQCIIESSYILSHVRSDLMGMNQCLTSLMGIVCRFEMQQKIGVQLMPEQWFQSIILSLKPGSSFFC